MRVSGIIQKMKVRPETPVSYALPVGQELIEMNPLLGQTIEISWSGSIFCVNCSRRTNKSFNQGYCYPCFQRLAECDMCVVKPERCHFHEGTCRQPDWGREHCFQPHTVYIANSSALKVGITRGRDPRTRWIDQGASQALAIQTVPNRLEAGRLEVALSGFVGDKTNWRKMLKGAPEILDLEAERDRLMGELEAHRPDFAPPGEPLADASPMGLSYPVEQFPEKIIAHNFDKVAVLSGELAGIKGQYLYVGDNVVNMRKYAGYDMTIVTP